MKMYYLSQCLITVALLFFCIQISGMSFMKHIKETLSGYSLNLAFKQTDLKEWRKECSSETNKTVSRE